MKKLTCLLLLAIAFSACKKDSSNKMPAPVAPSVLGTWAVSEASVVVSSNNTVNIGAMKFTFNSDGTVVEDFGGGVTTTYNYTIDKSGAANYVKFSQSSGVYLNDYVRTLNNEQYILAVTNANSISLTRNGPLNDGTGTSYLTVYNLAK